MSDDDAPPYGRHGRIEPLRINVYMDLERGLWWNLTHPHKFVAGAWRVVRNTWSRALWGYDDCDMWSVDNYLLLHLPPLLRRLKEAQSYSPFIRVGGVTYESPLDENGQGTVLYLAMLESCAEALDGYYVAKNYIWPMPYESYEDEAYMAAQIALCLISENLATLWD